MVEGAEEEQDVLNASMNSRTDSERLVESQELSQCSEGDDTDDQLDESRSLGWITGVAGPVSLSMFSTLLFLRVGYIVGNAGWLGGVLLLCLAYAILLITVFSISAVATNGQVRAGGVYFMISRTMGIEVGAAIGVLFFLANAVAVALFATGVAEGLFNNLGPRGLLIEGVLPSGYWFHLLYCGFTLAVNFVICIFGAKYFGRFSFFVLLLVIACTAAVMISFTLPNSQTKVFNETAPHCKENCTYHLYYGNFYGFGDSNSSYVFKLAKDNLWFNMTQDCEVPDEPVDFSTVFAVLFSGVTGIMAGANLSGDLKRPSKAIPLGTNVALLFTFVVYFILFILTGLTCDRTLLYHDCQYMTDLTFSGWIVFAGTMLTCWCASCSCLIGASRILQAVLDDVGGDWKITRIINAKTRSGNPYGAVIATTLLSGSFLLIGSLNKISKLCCIFFLLSYFGVNASCFCLDWAAAPNFRPTFHMYHWSLALIGMGITFVITWFISARYAGVSWFVFILLFVIFVLMKRRNRGQDWGHIGQAILFHQVRKYLLYLDSRLDHVKYWRPQVILFVDNPRYSCSIIEFVNVLKKSGLYVLAHVYEQDFDNCQDDPTLDGKHAWMALIDKLKVKAFPELTVTSSLREGVQHLIRLSGVGAMKANTVLFGFPEERSIDNEQKDDFAHGDYKDDDLDARFPKLDFERRGRQDRDAEKFIAMVTDVLKMRRSVCVHRNFDRLRHEDWFAPMPFGFYRKKHVEPVFLDVWLVDFFAEPNSTHNDVCCMFVLQLACIVNMVRKYSGCTVRTLIRVQSLESDGVDELKAAVQRTLADARINSTVETVVLDAGEDVPAAYNLHSISEDYMRRMNEKMRELSEKTVVSFVSLGRPPSAAVATSEMKKKYLALLDILTKDLPPVLLIHGIDSVVTDTV